MKKRTFLLIVFSLISFFIVSIILSKIYTVAHIEFSHAMVGFLSAILMLIEWKNALNPLKKFGEFNPVKRMFHKIGRPRIYRNFTMFLFVFFLLLGVFSLVNGIGISC